jgi:diketogulonate reductase-like aldo/keto reductase
MPIGFGTYRLRKDACRDAVYDALRLGYRLIDTACMYRNHVAVGQGIAMALRDGICRREDICVTTKVMNGDQSAGAEKIRSVMEHAIRKELQLDYVDIILVHNHLPDRYESTWACLEELRENGLCKHLGVSNHYGPQLQALLDSPVCKTKPILNQLEISPLHVPHTTMELCRAHDIVVQAHSPVIKGLRNQDPAWLALCQEYHFDSVPQMLLAWSHHHKKLHLVVRGETTDHRQENWKVQSMEKSHLDSAQALWHILDQSTEVFVTHPVVGSHRIEMMPPRIV